MNDLYRNPGAADGLIRSDSKGRVLVAADQLEALWEMFPNIWFRESKTVKLLESLEAYHRKPPA